MDVRRKPYENESTYSYGDHDAELEMLKTKKDN